MKQTINLKLNKPEYNDVVDVEKLNANFDAIDSKLSQNATESADGLMSKDDKEKLDGIATGANKTIVDAELSASSTNPVQNKVLKTILDKKAGLSVASESTSGLMSADDKKKLNGISIDGELSATSVNPVQNKIIKTALDGKAGTTVATQSANGLLSSGDKTKLDGIATGANKTVVDSAMSSTSTNPVQNKVVYAELSKKINASAATQSTDGLMSSDDKKKLDGIESGANKTTVDNAMSSDSTNPVQNKVIQAALNWKMSTSPGFIELNPGANAGHGGYLDFHYNGSSEDYTSRIIEQSSGVLNVPGTFKVNDSNVLTEASISTLLLKMYPVGSIYISTSHANPKTLFGGTWVQIKDVFLLAAGTTYKGGATGGEATHTLTLGEMPEHAHEMYSANGNGSSTWTPNAGSYLVNSVTDTKNTWWAQIGMNNAGGGTAHNNMPPYLVVYVWKRTA